VCRCVFVRGCVCVCLGVGAEKGEEEEEEEEEKKGGGRGESFPFSAIIYSPNAPFWDTGSCWASGVFVPHRDSPIP